MAWERILQSRGGLGENSMEQRWPGREFYRAEVAWERILWSRGYLVENPTEQRWHAVCMGVQGT